MVDSLRTFVAPLAPHVIDLWMDGTAHSPSFAQSDSSVVGSIIVGTFLLGLITARYILRLDGLPCLGWVTYSIARNSRCWKDGFMFVPCYQPPGV